MIMPYSAGREITIVSIAQSLSQRTLRREYTFTCLLSAR